MENAADNLYPALKSRFLDELSGQERLRVFDLTTRTARELHHWAARFSLIRRVRVWPLSLSVSAAAPFSAAPALVSTARMSLWVFTVDDLFDEEIVPAAELRRRVERYRAIARGGSRAEQLARRDSLGQALLEIRSDLARYPLFPALAADWLRALEGTLTTMFQEHKWRAAYREAPLTFEFPSYEEYVASGLYSIGGPPHVWTELITIEDPSIPEHLDHLRGMEYWASRCIRLANDLQSHEKEIDEGKINSLLICKRDLVGRGLPPAEAIRRARADVAQDIRESLARCEELRAQARTKTGLAERAIADIARFVSDFYVNHDYHTFSPAGSDSLVGASSAR